MNNLNCPCNIYQDRNIFTISMFVLGVIGLIIVFNLALVPPTLAGFDCFDNSRIVTSEPDLNSAINCYNSNYSEGDFTITFAQSINLTASTTGINNRNNNHLSLIIDGAGFAIDGQNIGGTKVFTNNSPTHVTIKNLTIRNGRGNNGGGIGNVGNLLVSNVILSSNSATAYGGGIYNRGNLTINNSSLSGNSAAFSGGGIYNNGDLVINNTTINHNNSASYGGGIYNLKYGNLTINNSDLNGNSADLGGGILSFGLLNLNTSTLSGNSATSGGGIYSSNIFRISNSTLNGNVATYGGGISNHGDATISNSTLSSNSATRYGGGIYNNGTATISSSTLSGNSSTTSGGIDNFGTLTTLSLDNSIVANSIGNDCINHGSGKINDNGHNIVEDNSCGFINGKDPLLGPLQDNGGSAFTHALLANSPAIDAGDTSLTTDQRGISRPDGKADDIGAYEGFEFSNFVYLPVIFK